AARGRGRLRAPAAEGRTVDGRPAVSATGGGGARGDARGVRVAPRDRAFRVVCLRGLALRPADARARGHTGRGEPGCAAVAGGGAARLAHRAVADGARELAPADARPPLAPLTRGRPTLATPDGRSDPSLALRRSA